MTETQTGTMVCYTGTPEFQAAIGGYNGTDHLLTQRSDNGPDIWSSRFRVGTCGSLPKTQPYIMIAAGIIAAALFYQMLG